MAKKKIGKKRNKIDPIIHLAEKNKAKSTSLHTEKLKHKIYNGSKTSVKREWQEDFDPRIADTDADTLFREMKRRDF